MKSNGFILSEKDLNEDYEDLVFRKVMAIHCEEESKEILEEIKNSKNESISGNKEINKIFNKFDRKENFTTLANIAKKSFLFAASFVFVVIISISSAVVASADVRDTMTDILYHLVFEENERYTKISAGETTGFIDPEIYDWEGAYAPTYMPEGFKLIEKTITEADKAVVYSNGENTIYFMQTKNISFRLDSEDADEIKNLNINGSDAICIKKDGTTKISWMSGDTIFWINGDISSDELIKVAYNIKILK